MKRLALVAAAVGLVVAALWLPTGPGNQAAWTVLALSAAGLAVAAGFVAFESRGATVRDVALVAVLGAAAGALRVPFAAIPGVQPTTFVVMAVGFALGPVNGFVVGVLAAVSSNTVLGHGPWTLLQAVAWGLAGASAYLVPRRWGRWGLAGLGLAWGLAFGAITNVYVWLTTQPVLTVRSYLAVAWLSLPLDVAHGVATAGLFVVAGPAVLRVLGRARERVTVRFGPIEERDDEPPEPEPTLG